MTAELNSDLPTEASTAHPRGCPLNQVPNISDQRPNAFLLRIPHGQDSTDEVHQGCFLSREADARRPFRPVFPAGMTPWHPL